MNPGDTFVPRAPGSHLAIVVATCGHGNALFVRVTKDLHWKDRTCQIAVGEHPWITRDTLIHYTGAMIVPNAALDAQVGVALDADVPVSPALLQRVRDGFGASPYAQPVHQSFAAGGCRCAPRAR